MTTTIRPVTTRAELKSFVRFPNRLYADNKFYVPQIESMELDTLSPGKNHAFDVCEAQYWLAYNEKGEITGRIAGIINRQYNEKVGQKICRFGWMDFINSPEVVKALLSTVEDFARNKGMDTINGPVGFLEFDISGILVEGFDQIPTAYGKYNAPYYEPLITENGYEKDADYVEYRVEVPDNIPDRYFRYATLVAEKYHLHEAPVRRKKDLLPYAEGIFSCMNSCYSKLHGYSELSAGQCEDLKNQFFPNLNTDYVSVILDSSDRVIAFGICLPSLSKALQKAAGRMFPFGFVHILKALRKNDTIDTLLISISDEYKDKGVNAMIFAKVAAGIRKNGIRYMESTRELEHNVQVQNLWNHFEHALNKRARSFWKKLC